MRRFCLPVLILAAVSCTAGVPDNPQPDTSPTPSASPTPTPGPTGDALTFQNMLDGTLAATEGFHTISESDGWPIQTTDGFVFARLADGSGPYQLAGDFNEWTPQAMDSAAEFFYVVVEIPNPNGMRYKFVSDAGDYAADPDARRYGYDEFGEYSLVRATDAHLQRYRNFTDGIVSPRSIRVWVPAGPVVRHLYVHDGQNLFAPDAIWGGWQLQTALGSGTMAIGIDSNADRMTDYTHVTDELNGQTYGGGGDNYADFVDGRLRSFIELQYGTADHVGVMGSSLGGLISFHIAQRHAGRYAFAASLSGTLGWGSMEASNETLIERFVSNPPLGTALYLDSGGGPGSGCVDSDLDGVMDDAPDSSDNYCENRQLADALPGTGYVFDTSLWHWWEPDAPHNEAAWAERVWRPVGFFEAL